MKYWALGFLSPDFFFQPHIYRASGETVSLPPGRLTAEFSRGPEYRVLRREVDPLALQILNILLVDAAFGGVEVGWGVDPTVDVGAEADEGVAENLVGMQDEANGGLFFREDASEGRGRVEDRQEQRGCAHRWEA